MAKSKSKDKYRLEVIKDGNGKPIVAIGSGSGKLFVESYFSEASDTIRIASSYFNLKGYEIGERLVSGKKIDFKILVGSHNNKYGQEGQDAKEVQKVILSIIKEELKECNHLWATAIESLVNRIENDTIQIKEARETDKSPMFHSKFYIIDDNCFFHGSANFSNAGLQNNGEQLSLIKDTETIKKLTQWYEEIILKSRDLKGDLLKILKAWLNLNSPFEIYLKIIHLLNNWSDTNVKKYSPNYYQKVVIQSALKKIEEYGGTLLVAATGLGKTIIGSEIVFKLQNDKKSKRTIIIAPPNVHGEWEKQLELRDITKYIFGSTLLFKEDSKKEKNHHQIAKLKEKLEEADEFTTIIIDEVHLYRNEKGKEKTDNKISSVYERLVPAINRKAKIILLTATPYASNISNVNSILHLLPHNAKSNDLYKQKEEWKVDSIPDFIHLPVVTIIGLPHVLKLSKQRGDVDSSGRVFVEFGNEKRFFPKSIKIIPIQYDLFLKDQLEQLFNEGLFNQKYKIRKRMINDDTGEAIDSQLDILYNEAISSWLSSPLALKEAIEQNISSEDQDIEQPDLFNIEIINAENSKINIENLGYKAELRHFKENRIKKLQPILGLIDTEVKSDDKYAKLKSIIDTRYKISGSKILIFVKRYRTAIYLLDLLKSEYGVKVTSTVELNDVYDKVSKPTLKEKHKRINSAKSFSPKSNDYENKAEIEYDILICTDADGVGINLQDCDTIINYDLPETADSLFQRLGRILRMTTNPNRVIWFYSLIPSIINKIDENSYSTLLYDISNSFNRLSKRHDRSKSILGTAIMDEKHQEKTIELDDEKNWEELALDEGIIKTTGESEVESQLSHFATYEMYKEKVVSGLDFMHSCMVYSNKMMRIVILMKINDTFKVISYNITEDVLEHSKSNFSILNLIACKINTPKHFYQASEIENYTNNAILLWCDSKKIPLENVEKICALLLIPDSNKDPKKIVKDFIK